MCAVVGIDGLVCCVLEGSVSRWGVNADKVMVDDIGERRSAL